MNTRAISYTEFMSLYDEERLILTTGINDRWDVQRHIQYIVELQANGNADNVQFIATQTKVVIHSIDVILNLHSTKVINFRVKTLEEKEREYLAENWQNELDKIVLLVEQDNPSDDALIENMLPKLKPYDRDVVETLSMRHDKYKACRMDNR